MKKDVIIMKKKLGAYYLVEFKHDNQEFYYIQLYKKCGKEEYKKIYEPRKFELKDRDRAWLMYNCARLKNMNIIFKERRGNWLS